MGRFIRTTIATLLVAWLGLLLASMIAALTRRSAAHVPDESSDELDILTVYDELNFTSRAGELRGGTIELWFGGGTVDLRGATLAPGGATITTRSVFGGGELVVPDDWNVTTRIVGIGGAGDGRPVIERSPDAPHLTLDGVALFGGWGVVSRPPEEEAALAVG
jgi:hypothetical protein